MKQTVWELEKGDDCYVEDSLGDLRKLKVAGTTKYQVRIGGQRFYKKSGEENHFKGSKLSLGLQPHRDRIHLGNGVLFTDEDADRRTIRQREEARRESLIYHITHLTSSQLRKFSTATLLQIVLLTTEVKPDGN